MPPSLQERMRLMNQANRQLGIRPPINYGDDLPQQQRAQIAAMQQQQRRNVQKQIQRRRATSTPFYPAGPTLQQRNALLRKAILGNSFAKLEQQSNQSQQPVAGSRGLNPRTGAIRINPIRNPSTGLIVLPKRQSRQPSQPLQQKTPQPKYVTVSEILKRKEQARLKRQAAKPVAGIPHYAALQFLPRSGQPVAGRQRMGQPVSGRQRMGQPVSGSQTKSHYAKILPNNSPQARAVHQKLRLQQAGKQQGRRYAQQYARQRAAQQKQAAQTAKVIARLRAQRLARA